jgi:hypothetical protein
MEMKINVALGDQFRVKNISCLSIYEEFSHCTAPFTDIISKSLPESFYLDPFFCPDPFIELVSGSVFGSAPKVESFFRRFKCSFGQLLDGCADVDFASGLGSSITSSSSSVPSVLRDTLGGLTFFITKFTTLSQVFMIKPRLRARMKVKTRKITSSDPKILPPQPLFAIRLMEKSA